MTEYQLQRIAAAAEAIHKGSLKFMSSRELAIYTLEAADAVKKPLVPCNGDHAPLPAGFTCKCGRA